MKADALGMAVIEKIKQAGWYTDVFHVRSLRPLIDVPAKEPHRNSV
jgi:hypothetical protein